MKYFKILFILILPATGVFGQTTTPWGTPGKDTRGSVERELLKPINELSPTFAEYQQDLGRLFIQYRDDDTKVVDRIEYWCLTVDYSCDSIGDRKLLPSLPAEESVAKYDGDKWKLLYGAPYYVALIGSASDKGLGRVAFSRIAYYSKYLWEAEYDDARQKNEQTYKREGSLFFKAGILNGKVVGPPTKAEYPPAAKAVRAGGIVRVAVSLDETGRVVGAQAVEGHALLRGAAEKAAMLVRLTPTIIDGKPVKVVGWLTYNFSSQ